MREKAKIGIAIAIALVISFVVTKTVFLSGTPRSNPEFIASLPSKTGVFISDVLTAVKEIPVRIFVFPTSPPVQITPTSPYPTNQANPTNTQISSFPTPTGIPGVPTVTRFPWLPTFTPIPTNSPFFPTATPRPSGYYPTPTTWIPASPTPTRIIPSATRIPPTPTRIPPTPTRPPTIACSTTSNQQYHEQGVGLNDPDKLRPPVESSPDVNIMLRGFVQVNEGANLISRNGNNYGLDPLMPPQISSLYGGVVPQIIKTYRVYEWDWTNNRSGAPQTATPAYPVHMLGLAANPGQPLVGLRAGRQIDSEGDVFLTLYASNNYVLFSHSADDNLFSGYLFYFVDICVDPNLLSTYQRNNNEGRIRLPAIAPGQPFGYAPSSGEVKYVIRDTMSFMDTRYREDWWFYGQ